jgi:alcohol oxidase
MGMFTKLPKELEEVDVIVAGGKYHLNPSQTQRAHPPRLTRLPGGLAGCVVAGRLAEADPGLSILVIEQGPNNYEVDQVVYPALYPRNLFPNSKYTLFWQGNHSPQLADRRPIVPSGGTLGGG